MMRTDSPTDTLMVRRVLQKSFLSITPPLRESREVISIT